MQTSSTTSKGHAWCCKPVHQPPRASTRPSSHVNRTQLWVPSAVPQRLTCQAQQHLQQYWPCMPKLHRLTASKGRPSCSRVHAELWHSTARQPRSSHSSTRSRHLLSKAAAYRPSSPSRSASPAPTSRDYTKVEADDPALLETNGQGYDAAANAAYWDTRPVPVLARVLAIAREFGWWWLTTQYRHQGDGRAAAAALREVLVRLGPAFVKIGQALSSRPDVMPPDYLLELELLQDRIPPFPTAAALATLQQELGQPVSVVYQSFGAEPVAAASLGQVYRARLRSGEEVAVKVQRPGVVSAIALDTYILRWVAGLLKRWRKLNTDLPLLVDEWASSLFRELDYTREAANAQRFARLFAFMPEVKVPEMYLEYTTPKVLTMEWIDGRRLRSASQATHSPATPPPPVATAAAALSSSSRTAAAAAATAAGPQGASRKQLSPEALEDLRLVEIGVRCSLEQMLEEGFYHADPHPGNLLKTRDGRLAYLDFGMTGEIDVGVRQALIRATLHLVNREYDALAQDFVALGLLPQGSDMGEIIPALTGVFQEALAGGVSNLSFGVLSTNLGRTMYAYSFRIPPYYTLLVRSLSVLEGIALASDPDYKVLGAAYPWISRRLLTQPSEELRATLRQLLYTEGRFRFDRLEQLLEQAAKAAVGAAATAGDGGGSSSGAGGGLLRPGSPLAPSGSSSSGDGAQHGSSSEVPSLLPDWTKQLPVIGWAAGQLGEAAAAVAGVGAGDGSAAAAGLSGRGSAAATAGGPLALLLSPEGSYVREILEEELAKGLDAAWRLAADSAVHSTVTRVSGVVASATGLLPSQLQQLLPPVLARSAGEERDTRQEAAEQLLEAMVTLPKLAAEEDVVQVDGIVRLAQQLQALGKAQHAQHAQHAGHSSSRGAAWEQLEAASSSLQWLASEMQLLGPAARQEALTIPLAILQKFSGRLAARALRAALAANGNSNGRQVMSGRQSPAPRQGSDTGSSSSSSRVASPVPGSSLSDKRGGNMRVLGAPGNSAVAATAAAAAAAAPGSSSNISMPFIKSTTAMPQAGMATSSSSGEPPVGAMPQPSSRAQTPTTASSSRRSYSPVSSSSWGRDPAAAVAVEEQVAAVLGSGQGDAISNGDSLGTASSSSSNGKRSYSPVSSSSWGREPSAAAAAAVDAEVVVEAGQLQGVVAADTQMPSSSSGSSGSSSPAVPDVFSEVEVVDIVAEDILTADAATAVAEAAPVVNS